MGIWYRPPAIGEIESIRSLLAEWLQLQDSVIGTIVVGDLNVHHVRWLRFSTGISVEGSALLNFCMQYGFKQMVNKSTREDNLLDLVLTDLPDILSTEVYNKIADHNRVRCQITFEIPESTPTSREVFIFKDASWDVISNEFQHFD